MSVCGLYWICRIKNNAVECRTKVSVYANTFLAYSKITLKTFFYIFNEWRKNVIAEITAEDLVLATSTAQRWNDKFSKAFIWKIKNEMPRQIGGVGKIVEFDETLLVKRKFHRGRVLSGQKWVVVGIERGEKTHYFVEYVPHRDRASLLPVITRCILPGTTIITDDWGAYRRLCRYTSNMEYNHFVVVHARNFVDPTTGAHTQNVEGINSVIKRVLRKTGTNLGDVNDRINSALEQRWKIFKRRELFQFALSAILEYSAFH